MSNISQTFSRLVYTLDTNPRDFCLFLGAGASVSSGARTGAAIAYEICKELYQIEQGLILDLSNARDKQKLEEWFKDEISFPNILMKFAGDKSRRDIIKKHIESQKLSIGYEKLAYLIMNGFFRAAFTTNFENLIEKALQSTGLMLNSDFEVLIVGKDKEEVIKSRLYDILRNKNKLFLILKLHGDINYPVTLKLIKKETQKFPKKIMNMLKACFSKYGIIFVGYGGNDPDVIEILNQIENLDYPHWWVSKTKISNPHIIKYLRNTNMQNNLLWEEKNHGPGIFDDFFTILYESLLGRNIRYFMKEVPEADNFWYRNIDKTFVPPNEYKDILECLEKQNVVFLIGDPEIGKTFTAVKLLWEFYRQGYKPIWHPGSEKEQRMKIRGIISDIKLENRSVIYFEDPFGKFKFEDREELRRKIGNFFIRAQELDVKIIISSREEVFKKFEKEKLSESNLQNFVKNMNLKKPSYTREKKIQILLNWATEFDCKWLYINKLKSYIINEGINYLQTPLSISNFAFSSKNCLNIEFIKDIIKIKSKETKNVFTEEILCMEKEKELFLNLIYILQNVINIIELNKIYNNICEKFKLNLEDNSFEYLKEWFKTKISINKYEDRDSLEFNHPLYEEGLIQSWNNNKKFILDIFKVLINNKLHYIRGVCGYVMIKNYYEILFKKEAELIIENILLDKNAITRAGVAIAIQQHFNTLPLELGLKYLHILLKDRHRENRSKAVETIKKFYKLIPHEESMNIIKKGLEDRAAYVRLTAVSCVTSLLDELPEEISRMALKRCKELCNYSGWFISYFAHMTFYHLKERIEKKFGN